MQEMRIYLLNNTKPYREGDEEYSGAWFFWCRRGFWLLFDSYRLPLVLDVLMFSYFDRIVWIGYVI